MKYHFDPFSVEYDIITSPVGDFKAECILAAHKAVLANNGDLPIVVMMSGGIDSELVAESLLLAKIPFKCVIGKLVTEVIDKSIVFNEHDYQYAERWCKKNNIEVIYCELDIFKQNKLLCEYALSAKGFSPQYGCHMYIMKWCSDQGYFFLAGNGEIDIVLRDDRYYIREEQRDFAIENFCSLHNLTGIAQFWKQDTKLIASLLRLPTVKWLMEHKLKELLPHKHEYFADVFQFENRYKATGFEKVQEWDYILRTHLKEFNGEFDNKYYTPIEHFKEI